MNYELDIKIDETALDVEWLDQANLMLKYARHSAEKRKELDEAKERLELVGAELNKEIRNNPTNYGIDKITEALVTAVISTQPEYVEATETLIQAKFESDVAYGAVKAVDARKDALENLVKLLGMQYFAGPKEPRNLHEQKEIRQNKINASIAQKRKVFRQD
jgi:altronate dehydratase